MVNRIVNRKVFATRYDLSSEARQGRFSIAFFRSAASVARLSLGGRARGGTLNLHRHHEVGQPVPGPAAQPGDLPIAEARANRDGCAKAEELGFELHGIAPLGGTTVMALSDGDSQVESRFHLLHSAMRSLHRGT